MSNIPREPHPEEPIIPEPSIVDPQPGRTHPEAEMIEPSPVSREVERSDPEPPPTQTGGSGKPPRPPKKTAVAAAGRPMQPAQPPNTASASRRKNFATFRDHPLHDEAIRLIKQALVTGRLSVAERGITWGVTVCTDRDTLIRLNIGHLAQLSVMKHSPWQPDETDPGYLLVAAVVPNSHGVSSMPRGLRSATGFVKHVPNSVVLHGPFTEWMDAFFADSNVQRGFHAHCTAARRPLRRTNWHNPLVNSLLDGR